MNNKEKLLIILNESDSLLADTSTFTLLGVNNPIEKTWDKIPGKGYYLSALALFSVLGLYSRIYFAIKKKTTLPLKPAQEKALEEIKTKIKENKLKKYFIIKKPSSILSSDEDFFYKFMNDLDEIAKINLGLKQEDFRPIWKQIRNMLSHVSFSFIAIGGKHIPSEDHTAPMNKTLNLPNYDSVHILAVFRANYSSTEIFTKKETTFTLNTSLLLAYMEPIKNFILNEIEQTDDNMCGQALNSIKEVISRQQGS